MTDFRARGTIMGPTGLTAVFGMGTGVTPSVWSPEIRPAGVFRPAGRDFGWSVAYTFYTLKVVARSTRSLCSDRRVTAVHPDSAAPVGEG